MQETDKWERSHFFLEIGREDFIEFEKLPTRGPIQMVNLLKFKERTSDGVSGASKYDAYLKMAKPFFSDIEMKILFFGSVQQTMIGPGDEWDKILIAEYASKEDFLKVVTKKEYPSAMRLAALADSRLLCCTCT